MLASPRFQRRAAAFALTRPLARRHARELFDLVAGFVYSQVLLACVRLHLFEILAEGPQSLERLAARLDLPVDAAQRLVWAAVSLRLVERRSEGRYGLGELGAPMVGRMVEYSKSSQIPPYSTTFLVLAIGVMLSGVFYALTDRR